MRFFIARSKVFEKRLCISKNPLKLASDGVVWFQKEHGNAGAEYLTTPTPEVFGINPGEGAYIEVTLSPAKGYTPVKFTGCTEGVKQFLGEAPKATRAGYRTAYFKCLKVETAPHERLNF